MAKNNVSQKKGRASDTSREGYGGLRDYQCPSVIFLGTTRPSAG